MDWAVEIVEVHRRPLLRGVSFGARARAVTAVAGGSAEARTLLFRLIAGLEGIDRGAVLVLGGDMSRARSRARGKLQRRLGVVFGGPDQALFGSGSAWDNVELAVRTAGRVGRRGVEAAVEEVLDRVGLGFVAGERPGALTPAQRRRLAVARALVLRPPLLLVDALDGGGDPAEAAFLASLLHAERSARGAASVVFAHDTVLAARLADEVVDLGALLNPLGYGPSLTELLRT